MFDAFISNELGRLAPDVDVTEIASESRSDHFVVKATVVVRISRRSLMEFDDVHARYRELPSRNPDYEDWLAHKKKIDASVATIGPMPRPKPAPPEPDDELDVFGPSASNDKKQEK